MRSGREQNAKRRGAGVRSNSTDCFLEKQVSIKTGGTHTYVRAVLAHAHVWSFLLLFSQRTVWLSVRTSVLPVQDYSLSVVRSLFRFSTPTFCVSLFRSVSVSLGQVSGRANDVTSMSTVHCKVRKLRREEPGETLHPE